MQYGQAYISTIQWWHEALGHTSPQTWTTASERYSDGSLIPKRPSHFFCDACAFFNSKQITPHLTEHRAKDPYDLIHMDLAGPFSTQSLGKKLYHLPIIDDCTRYTESILLSRKSDAEKELKAFCKRVKNQTGRYPRIFRSDRGGEFISLEWKFWSQKKGIILEFTAASSHESIGVAERYNLTLANMCRPALGENPKFL